MSTRSEDAAKAVREAIDKNVIWTESGLTQQEAIDALHEIEEYCEEWGRQIEADMKDAL